MGFPVFHLVEFVVEGDAGAQFAVQADGHLPFGVGKMNNEVNAAPKNGKPRPAIGFHSIERAERHAFGIFLFLEHVYCRKPRTKPDHVDRFRELVKDFIPWPVYKNIEFEGAHGLILTLIGRLTSGEELQCYNL